MTRVGLLMSKPEGLPWVRRAMEILARHGVEVLLSEELSDALGFARAVRPPDWMRGLSFCVVFGGDGTVLRAVSQASPHGVPVVGVNFGHLGFLTEVEPADMEAAFARILAGEAFLEERMMLAADLPDGTTVTALNEIAIVRGNTAGILRAEVMVGDAPLDAFVADGFLVSTPTGSTAYALSCGGPIIEPSIECLLLLAVCPHSLRSRPVVLPCTESVRVHVTASSALALADGKGESRIEVGQSAWIHRADRSARFLRLTRRSYYALLQDKLSEWSR